jgi:L-threonylcarbamoyladenylate synthase
MAQDVDTLLDLVPELRGRAGVIARALLPGPLTLVLSNPARRFPWLTGERPETIGVRVPELPDVSAPILASVGALAATSANLSGGPDPATVDEVPAEIREACAAVVDGGRLPGTPSTVVDLTGPEPRVLREGLVSAAEVLERASAVTRS